MKTEIPQEALEQMKQEGWASIEEQNMYWLDRTESACQWFDARLEARIEAQEEYEDQQEAWNE